MLSVGVTMIALVTAWVASLRLDIVNSDSMGPTVPRGSLAIVGPANADEIDPGDVIAFRDPGDRSRALLHRVVLVVDQPTGRFFRTKGDLNRTPDPLLVPATDIQGRLRWHIPKLGIIARAMRPPVGWLLLVGLPALVFVVGEVRARTTRTSRRKVRSGS